MSEPNDLEECYRLASETGDDAKLLRALARNVVFISQPKDGTPVGQVTVRHHEPGQMPLPTSQGVDGRTYVLAFTSYEPMDGWYEDPELTWSMVPAGQLAATWPDGAPLLLATPNGSVVIESEDMRTVGLIFAGANVRAAFQPGPATPVGLKEPEEEPPGFFDEIRRVAEKHPEIEGALWCLAKLDEPEARVWPIVGVALAEGADANAVMPQAAESFGAFSEQYVELRALRPDRELDEIEQWLQAHGRPVSLR
jgi:hypothetical protein